MGQLFRPRVPEPDHSNSPAMPERRQRAENASALLGEKLLQVSICFKSP